MLENSFTRHPSDEQIEAFLLGNAASSLVDLIELHYLYCPPCLERLQAAEELLELRELPFDLRPATQVGPSQRTEIATVSRSGRPARRVMRPFPGGAAGAIAVTMLFGLLLWISKPPGRIGQVGSLIRAPAVPHESSSLVAALSARPVRTTSPRVRLRRPAPRVYRTFKPPTTTTVHPDLEVALIEPPDLLVVVEAKDVLIGWEAMPEIPRYRAKRNAFKRALSTVARAVWGF
jgi:hypothetical protein